MILNSLKEQDRYSFIFMDIISATKRYVVLNKRTKGTICTRDLPFIREGVLTNRIKQFHIKYTEFLFEKIYYGHIIMKMYYLYTDL